MAVGAFTDKARPPSPDAIDAALGRAEPSWRAAWELLDARGATGDLRYYGVNYGWAVRFRHKGRALASLFPGLGGSVALIVLPEPAQRQVEARVRPATRELLARATAYREGRWLFLPLVGAADVRELELLLHAKLAAGAAGASAPRPARRSTVPRTRRR